MNDIIVRKRIKKDVIRQNTKQTGKIYLSAIVFILIIVTILGNSPYVKMKYDNGLMWLKTDGSVTAKMIPQSVENPEDLLSIMQPKKQVKKAVSKTKDVWTAREAKYKPLIEKYFPEEPEVMLAIAKAESSLNSNAINYNCFYDKKGNVHRTRPKGGVSKQCNKGHEKFAWSKDGCAMQINSIHGFDITTPEGCFMAARKVYEQQGKRAWVAYNTGAYKKYLARK